MPPTNNRYNRQTAGREYGKAVSEDKVQGVLENVFGIKIPNTPQYDTEEDQQFAGVMENVYGVRLPSEMVSRAYSIFIKEYNQDA
jgi:hypothetical protein